MAENKDQMHPDDLRNLFIFIVLAVLLWVGFDHYLLKPKVEALREAQEAERAAQSENRPDNMLAGLGERLAELKPRQELIRGAERLRIDNGTVFGSLALTGGRIDDISLHDHYKTIEKREPVTLFSPMGSFHPRYVSYGWISSDQTQATPGRDTVWQVADGNTALGPGETVTLFWDNGAGLRFERDISLDEQYLFSVTQRVINNGGQNVTLYPYALLAQHGLPEDLYNRWIVHEGLIGYIGETLTELSYKKMADQKVKEVESAQGWIGMTEHYWLTSLFTDTGVDETHEFRFVYVSPEEAGHIQPRYQIDIMGDARTLAPGESGVSTTRLFAGPKDLHLLEGYERRHGWNHIDLAIDFGMYYFMTKPLYYLLHWLRDIAGNFGLGIILLTIVVRIVVFPLANTSYRSFAGLRKIAPKMHELREKYSDDKERLQHELVKLYEREKVNPMAGCLPILIQIPIFFALFKVLQISVEMRHAPFFGWINDLAAPDPTSIFNLFGLIPWSPPAFLMIGAWPCIMLVFMILQKKMSPPPQDKMQKAMMDFMPFFITFILAKFAAGLVIYWTFSNALSVVQQYIIMKSMGVEPELFKSKAQKEEERKMREANVHPGLEMAEEKIEDALFGDGDETENKPAENAEEKKPVSKPKPKKKAKKKS